MPTTDEDTVDESSTNQQYENNRIKSQRYEIVWKGLKGIATIILFPFRLMDGILEFVFELIVALLEVASSCGCSRIVSSSPSGSLQAILAQGKVDNT